MPWPLRLVDGHEPWKDAQIGDCWYHPNWMEGDRSRAFFLNHLASHQYLEQWADKRPPIIVYLPSGPACPDEFYSRPENYIAKEGWTVTGSIEDGTLSVSPSINMVGHYHGFIQGSVVTDDVEGRHF